jgi:hypothetical protein
VTNAQQPTLEATARNSPKAVRIEEVREREGAFARSLRRPLLKLDAFAANEVLNLSVNLHRLRIGARARGKNRNQTSNFEHRTSVAVREGDTDSSSLPAQNQQVTKRVLLRCVTEMCRNLNRKLSRGQEEYGDDANLIGEAEVCRQSILLDSSMSRPNCNRLQNEPDLKL